MSKEEMDNKSKEIIVNMQTFAFENNIEIRKKENNSKLRIVYMDSYYVKNTVPEHQDESCFGVGITEELALLDLAITIESETIHNPYTKHIVEVPHFTI